ncbi:FadR/GntR family transcriptional regulator [Microbacterium pygmaeum]|uniref:DNA-binding transcriptional regulator, FadR family n=1 Tax=Microbacterium pygmaeum TaxID=370764 RepID=A0A1G7XAQ0_9MICO|nr:FadR/GntR family transcriptional regulator [Microbacterium pygmaeum]SDG81167.1 DNA-binding transcriptional regulator, FadR family [Microbacterium pygmaeum]
MTDNTSNDRGESTTRILGQKVLRPRQQVEEALRKAVLSGQLAAGERLPAETELARQFNVSRPTIREALSALESQGLIFKVPGAGGGSFVQTVDHNALGQVVQKSMHNLLWLGSISFDELAMVRQFLEVPAAALAAKHRTDADVEELRTIIDEQKLRTVDDPAVAELDARFHIAIARMSGNRILASLVYALHRETEPVSYLDLSPSVGRDTFAQHQSIFHSIADGDATAAEAAIIDHLTYLRHHIGPSRGRPLDSGDA